MRRISRLSRLRRGRCSYFCILGRGLPGSSRETMRGQNGVANTNQKYDNCYVPQFWTDSCYACVPDSETGQHFNNGSCTKHSDEFRLCNNEWPTDGVNYTASYTALRYRIMQNALEAQNRTILYSLCEWGTNEPWTWGNATANSWRTTGDVSRKRSPSSNHRWSPNTDRPLQLIGLVLRRF